MPGSTSFPPRETRSPRIDTAAAIAGGVNQSGTLAAVIPVFRADDVRAAVSPQEAYDAVREAFVAYARGEWTMPPKVYVANYPAGDFRAMPALGGGHALLKWVTSFPGNPKRGLPTVTGLVLLSDADDGRLLAVLDAATVTALRTAAAGVLASDVLAREGAGSWAVVGCGANGAETARMLVALGRRPVVWDVDETRRRTVAGEVGAEVASSAEEALTSEVVVTVTPGSSPLYAQGSLRAGQHVSLMGADGPGKAEVALAELARARLFCDDWAQASHGGELTAGVDAGTVRQHDVTELGDVLTGAADGRRAEDDITLFDSTGLAIQDLAIARTAFAKAGELDLATLEV
jgi:ornithine cyclodeaminase/alanine dehydrogenase-like protein (mu-crystallin family)